ncbi:mucin-3B-like isoform X3 [Melanotaenia boesemani]|uniref:mucin-3B-like isoform X3 n=1 Tax=Melanotaenia boesemani TaxID=1250792 RepID=UPI001C045441|nr:mucin-3B-like isoform X3 [Melanotaenia boesemani]
MIEDIASKSPDSGISVIAVNNLHPPKLMVDRRVITETDSVTLNCQTPSSVSVTECYFIIMRGKPAKRFSCLKTLSGTELLSLTQQSLPAKVDVTCFYLLSHPSPQSDKSTITIQLPRPELTVNPLMITETDSVTLNCQTPSSVSVTECYLYFLKTRSTRTISCVENLGGTELLMTARQSSPADVKLTCYYDVERRGGKYSSSHSNMSSIRIQNLHPPKLMVDRRVITETDSVTLNCQTPSSVSVTECHFIMRGKPAKMFSCLKTLSGTELLSITQQSLPAKVDVTCFYLLSHPSPQSDKSTITIQLPRPELTVNPLMITETDSVTLSCQTPSSVSVTECYLYFLQTKTTRIMSCVENLRGTELLMTAHQSSPADVKLTCYYDVEQRGGKYSSSHSNMSSIRIQNVKSSTESAFIVTTDFTVGTPPRPLLSASLTSVKPTSAGVSVGTTTNTVSSLSTSLTSVKPTSGVSVGTTTNTVNSLSTSLTSVKPAPETDSTDALTSEFPKTSQPPTTKTQQWKFMFVIGPAFGMSVGVILLVAAVLCSRRSEQRIYTRSQAKYAGNVMRMGDFDVGKWLSADNNEADTLTHSTPAADSSNGFVQVSTQKSESENADIYHVYSTIPDEPAASALMDTAYSTIQPH